MRPAMDTSQDPITRADFEEFGALLRTEIQQSAQALRAEIQQSNQALRAEIEQSNQALRAEIEQSAQVLRADIRVDIERSARELRTEFSHLDRTVAGIGGELRMFKWSMGVALLAVLGGLGFLYQGLTDLRSDMHRGETALREEIRDLGERTARLEEGQRHIHQRLAELIELANARALPPDAGGASGSPS